MTKINDFAQFAALRADATAGRESALRDVAEQFEALFVQNMLKSMRDASFGDTLFGDTGGLYRDMFDQQIATDIAAGPGIGFADLLVRQLGGTGGEIGEPDTLNMRMAPVAATAATKDRAEPTWQNAREFIQELLPHARAAAQKMNVNPLAILAQAALETGWGKHVMPDANGDSSLNLFGIKAGSSWSGDSVNRMTVEFDEGVASRRREPFRTYSNLGETFSDYVKLLTKGERYQAVTGAGDDVAGFADSLQRAGYATDPSYARKIANIAGGDTMKGILAMLKEPEVRSLARQLGVTTNRPLQGE